MKRNVAVRTSIKDTMTLLRLAIVKNINEALFMTIRTLDKSRLYSYSQGGLSVERVDTSVSRLGAVTAEEPKGIFLPDIDKKISAIPQQLLQNQTNNANTQMVLYQVPSSISVPEEQDHVRKAIIATRARAREQQARDAGGNKNEGYVTYENRVNGLVPGEVGQKMEEDDPDAMELG